MDGPGPPFCLGAPPALRPPRLGRQSGTRCGPLPPRAPNTALRQAPGLPGAGAVVSAPALQPGGCGREWRRGSSSPFSTVLAGQRGRSAHQGACRGPSPGRAGPGKGAGRGTPVPVAPRKEIPAVLPHIWPLLPASRPSLGPRLVRHPPAFFSPAPRPGPGPRNLERALGAGQDTLAHALSSSSSAGGSGISHLGGRGRGDAGRRCNWPAATQLARAGLGFGAQQDAARAEPLAQCRTAWLWVSACASWDRRVEAGGTRGSWRRPPVSARWPGRAAGAHRPSHARARCPCGLFTCPWPLGQVPEWQLCPEPPRRPVQHPHLSGVPAFPWELTVPRCVHLCSGGGGVGEVSARPALRNHLVYRASTSLRGTVSPARVWRWGPGHLTLERRRY